MSKSILIMRGSPRNGGNSGILADQLSEGARQAGARVESVFVHRLNISPCCACAACHQTGGVCALEDDMQKLYPKIRTADALVVSSPIYWYNITAQTKTWIDRCYSLVMDPAGDPLEEKEYAFLLTYASPLISSGVTNALLTLKDMFSRGTIIGVVHGRAHQAGEIQKHPLLLEKAYDLGYKLGESSP